MLCSILAGRTDISGLGHAGLEVGGEPVQGGQEAGLGFGAAGVVGDVGLVDADLGAGAAEVGEGGGGGHSGAGLGPYDPLRRDDLGVHGVHGVRAAVVADHDGLEDAAGVRVDRDPVQGCAGAGRAPEVGQVL